MIHDILPSYNDSLLFVEQRISELEAKRDAAIKRRKWANVTVLGHRLAALYDTRINLVEMIREIERH